MADNSLAAAVARSVRSRGSSVTPADEATVALALRYAHQIEAGIERGGQDATKALYLGPHLLKVLGALGCSPEGRDLLGGGTVEAGGGEAPVSPAAVLADFRSAHRGRA